MAEEGPRGWGAPLHARLLDVTGAGPGATLLDLGCGAGVFARAAADRGVSVTGLDLDPGAVAAAAALVPEGRFRVGDAHDPPAGPFDVVAAVQLLAHVANPVVVLKAAAAAGGTVAVTVWGREDECDVHAFGEALAPWLGPRRQPAGPPPVTEPARLEQLAGLAGLRVDSVEEVLCPFDYPDADDLIAPLMGSAIGRHAINRAGPVAVREAVLERLAARRTPDGGYRLRNLFRLLVARSA